MNDIKYKNKLNNLRGGSIIPVILFQEFHNHKEISMKLLKIF